MSLKSSLPQLTNSVSRALIPDTGVTYNITMLDNGGNAESTGYLVPFDPTRPGTLAFIANK